MVAEGHSKKLATVVVTFHPHPAAVLRGRMGDFYLTLPEERVQLLFDQGADGVVVLPFDVGLAATSARDFMAQVKKHLGLKILYAGQDFALGRGREGNIEVLRQLGLEMDYLVQVVEPVSLDGQMVSSSRIRALLEAGDVSRAAAFLGRPYRLSGKVVPGDQRGRLIGIPTANLQIQEGKLKPAGGVYACRAWVGETAWAAAVNIGVRPTFDGEGSPIHVEAHLLDFTGDLYGQSLSIEFLEYLRGERRFASVQALVEQIHIDLESTRRLYGQV